MYVFVDLHLTLSVVKHSSLSSLLKLVYMWCHPMAVLWELSSFLFYSIKVLPEPSFSNLWVFYQLILGASVCWWGEKRKAINVYLTMHHFFCKVGLFSLKWRILKLSKVQWHTLDHMTNKGLIAGEFRL